MPYYINLTLKAYKKLENGYAKYSRVYYNTVRKSVYEILPIASKRLKNLVSITIGVTLSKSVELSDISERLKDNFSEGTEDSKMKIIYRFFSSSPINTDYVYSFFIEEVIKKYVKQSRDRKITRTSNIYKEGISELNEIFKAYNYEVILLGDRGFKSIDLFNFINKLGLKYCIRCSNDMLVKIERKEKIKYLRDIPPHNIFIYFLVKSFLLILSILY